VIRIYARILVPIFAFALLPIFLLGNPADAANDPLRKWSRMVQVVAFESTNLKNQLPPKESGVTITKSAELPIRLSKAYFALSTAARFTTGDLGLPEDLVLLDVFTFSISQDQDKKFKPVRRSNNFVELTYTLKIHNLTDDFCEVEFAGSYHEKILPVVAKLSRRNTTLIRVGRLCFAFTFVKAAIEADDAMCLAKSPEPRKDFIMPKPVMQPLPEYPQELRRRNLEGEFRFLAIITEKGAVDPLHGIVLESYHWLFTRSALETIFNRWTFAPGQLADQPVNVSADIDVVFRLRN